jgi:hypothetical protein
MPEHIPWSLLLHVAHTVLCLGLNLLIARLNLDPRWRYVLWTVIVLNEIRGLVTVYLSGDTLLTWVR